MYIFIGIPSPKKKGEEKVVAFTEYINYALQGDVHLAGVLPMAPDDLFTTVADGLILCKLINRCRKRATNRALYHPCVCVCVCVCVYLYIYTYIHTYIHTTGAAKEQRIEPYITQKEP